MRRAAGCVALTVDHAAHDSQLFPQPLRDKHDDERPLRGQWVWQR
jgi:hypothetical protein